MFSEDYEIRAFQGGCLFLKDDFEKLQKCFLALGDKYCVVIENTFNESPKEPVFRMKFPTDITWEELMSGNYISAIILEMDYKEYFVFTESGIIGKYSANNYMSPVDLIGCKKGYWSSVQNYLDISEELKKEVYEFLPNQYKESTQFVK
jgi:hypothetical protein